MTFPPASGLEHPAVVVDASVWVSAFLAGESNHPASLTWLRRYSQSGGAVIAPQLLLAEVASGISRATGHPELAQQIVYYLTNSSGMELVSINSAPALNAAELELISKHGKHHMKYAVFGFSTSNLEQARSVVQEALSIDMVPHDSMYWGEYYLWNGQGEDEIQLVTNVDPLDGEPIEPEHRHLGTLLLVSLVPDKYVSIYSRLSSLQGINLIREEVMRF